MARLTYDEAYNIISRDENLKLSSSYGYYTLQLKDDDGRVIKDLFSSKRLSDILEVFYAIGDYEYHKYKRNI